MMFQPDAGSQTPFTELSKKHLNLLCAKKKHKPYAATEAKICMALYKVLASGEPPVPAKTKQSVPITPEGPQIIKKVVLPQKP